MAYFYTVVVENNVVSAIERSEREPEEHLPASPLEVASLLARNNREHGCIDGRYPFRDSQQARIFAELCLDYVRALIAKRLDVINKLPVGFAEYRADEGPIGFHGSDPP